MRPGSIRTHSSLLLLESCNSSNTLRQAHAHLLTTGLALHSFPLSRLLLLSSRLLCPSYAAAVLRHFPRPATAFLYNTLINSSLAAGRFDAAWSLYSRLAYGGAEERPNSYTYPSLLKACGWVQGRAVHVHILKFLRNDHDGFVQAALLSLYSRCGKIAACRHLFDQIPYPDVATWNAMLAAYARAADAASVRSNPIASASAGNGFCTEALCLFREMQLSRQEPDEITLVAVVGVCGELGALAQGAWAHEYVGRRGDLLLNHYVTTALIEMYGKCGRLELAFQVFESLTIKDTPCYNAMISGLASHGHGGRAIELLDRMRKDGLRANDMTMVVLMSACAHAGMVDEGCQLFFEMKEVSGIEPKREHYGCLVDLLGRAGRLEEAEEVIHRMPVKPNVMAYRSLLLAYKVQGKEDLGEHVIRQLMELEPGHGGNYVLLSNIYADHNRWNDAKKLREAMRDKGISKTPGISLVEVDGDIHEFTTGDWTNLCSEEIYAMLSEIGSRLRDSEHQPISVKEVFA